MRVHSVPRGFPPLQHELVQLWGYLSWREAQHRDETLLNTSRGSTPGWKLTTVALWLSPLTSLSSLPPSPDRPAVESAARPFPSLFPLCLSFFPSRFSHRSLLPFRYISTFCDPFLLGVLLPPFIPYSSSRHSVRQPCPLRCYLSHSGTVDSHQTKGVIAKAMPETVSACHEKFVECQGHKDSGILENMLDVFILNSRPWTPTGVCPADWRRARVGSSYVVGLRLGLW